MMKNFHDRLAAVPRTALWLGLAGLIPFVSGGIGVWLNVIGDIRFALPLIVLTYGCLIAAFLGGVRWGAAMQNNEVAPLPSQFILAIVPTLMALVAFMLPLPQAFTLLIVLFVAQGVLDLNAVQQTRLAEWYAPLRLLLTIIAALSMTSLLLHVLTH
ncbi:MAG TPA: hypothetical protein DCS39_01635 [Rhodobiaceae bacterium]|nr:hypothetical protein [Rhodobiaceae bacterium]